MTNLNEVRALLAASNDISPFPWSVKSDDDPGSLGHLHVLEGGGYGVVAERCTAPDAELIAAAPRLLAGLCDELDAAERGVSWEDVDLSTVTAVERPNGIFARRSLGWDDETWVEWLESPSVHPKITWFRDASGWHKVADR